MMKCVHCRMNPRHPDYLWCLECLEAFARGWAKAGKDLAEQGMLRVQAT